MKENFLVLWREISKEKHLMFFCLCFFWASVPTNTSAKSERDVSQAIQQDKVVNGVVFDETDIPVIGASIKVLGGSTGTITDLDGKFTISVPSDGKIEVSFIGYTSQTIAIKPETSTLKIVLKEDSQVLEEVVVVGYGTQKAKNITGSVSQISTDAIAELPVSNLSDALNGQINGLSVNNGSGRPGDAGSIFIRQSNKLTGISKDGAGAEPLVIIDDVVQIDPETGNSTLDQFNLLDPSEVESITVLRDASAAIYGSRASQGAIIVKTKRGKDSSPKISYSGKFATSDAISHSKTLNSYEYGRFANSLLKASGIANSPEKLYSTDELNAMKGLDYDWLNKAWSSAFNMTHSLNVNGGSDKATYFAGGSFYTADGNLGKQDYEKWTYRAGVDVKLTSSLNFSASISGNTSDQNKSYTKNANNADAYGGKAGEQGDYNLLLHMPQYIPWSVVLDDGNEYFTSPMLGPHQKSGNATSSDQTGSWNYFSLLDNGSGQERKNQSFSANFALSYDVPWVKGLKFKGTYATTRSSFDGEQVQLPFTLALVNNPIVEGGHLYSAHTSVSDYTIDLNDKTSRVVYDNTTSSYRQLNFYVNYDRSFGKHNISGMFSVERSDSEFKRARSLYNNPTVPYLGTSSTAGTYDPSNSYVSKSESGTLSYLGRFTYNYNDRYLLQFIFRSDASTKFAPENYWGFFPGVSAGWVISEESWFKKTLPWFEYLKLRGSWGRTGRDNLKQYGWMTTYSYGSDKGLQFGSSGGKLGSGLSDAKVANRNVSWDKTDKFNFGFDARFLNGRLSTNVDLYYEMNNDLLNQFMSQIIGTPISVGGAFTEMNFGRIDNYGLELSVNWRDKIGQVDYNIGSDFGISDGKYKEWPELAYGYPSGNGTREGKSTYNPIWGYRVWTGTSSGDGILRNQEDIDNYWNYLTENAKTAGHSDPSYFGSNSKDALKPGMMAYQDLYGDLNSSTGELAGPNGKIVKDEDMNKLSKKNRTYGITTKLGASWKGLTWNAMIATSWGGTNFIDTYKMNTSSNQMLWSPESYWTDMFDEETNPNGKYPNIGYGENTILPSDFWTVSTFRCYIKNMSIGYTLPKKWLKTINIETAKISLTGTNLWDFYNPYPKKYRNMYDSSTVGYPTLRTWSLGVNLVF